MIFWCIPKKNIFLYYSVIANEDGPDAEDEDEPQPPPPDNQTLLRLLEHHEKVKKMECLVFIKLSLIMLFAG